MCPVCQSNQFQLIKQTAAIGTNAAEAGEKEPGFPGRQVGIEIGGFDNGSYPAQNIAAMGP